jgi:protein dithiol oxidoreductase (disulfide-forming)
MGIKIMKSIWLKSILGLLLTLSTHALMAADYSAGKQYTQLKNAQTTDSGDKIEVLEFFWYGCPHCFHFEPTISKWKKNKPANVNFVRVPAPVNPSWVPHTKAYYALEMMGKGEQYHNALFKAMHIDKIKIRDLASITKFLVSQGVDEKKFNDAAGSFAVEMRVRKAMQLTKNYQLSGVPMLAVNGKYTISAQQAGGYDGMVNIANYLITKEAK